MNLQEAEKRIERLEEDIETAKVQREQLLTRIRKLEDTLREIGDSIEDFRT